MITSETDIYYYDSPLGRLAIGYSHDQIQSILFMDDDGQENAYQTRADYKKKISEGIHLCTKQMDEYFSGQRREFDFPFSQEGTRFQKKVWDELLNIPFGKVISYLELSKRIGDPKAIRAVGTSNGKNQLCIVVPCHRVIGSNGKLVGYGGGLWRKKWLLDHESKYAGGVLKLF